MDRSAQPGQGLPRTRASPEQLRVGRRRRRSELGWGAARPDPARGAQEETSGGAPLPSPCRAHGPEEEQAGLRQQLPSARLRAPPQGTLGGWDLPFQEQLVLSGPGTLPRSRASEDPAPFPHPSPSPSPSTQGPTSGQPLTPAPNTPLATTPIPAHWGCFRNTHTRQIP